MQELKSYKLYMEYYQTQTTNNKNIKLVDLFSKVKYTAFNKHQDCNAHVDKN